jgi:predicted nuclease with RNAse H fold
MTWVGIDYGSKLAGTTVLAFAKKGIIGFRQTRKKTDADQALHRWIKEEKPQQIFMDAPLSLPAVYRNDQLTGDYFYRQADRDLKAMSPMFLGGLTARAMRLAANLKTDLVVDFWETYPGYLAKILALPKDQYKKEKRYLPLLTGLLWREYSLELEQIPENWHQFDALLAYISGLRFQSGIHQVFGNPEEGQIVI